MAAICCLGAGQIEGEPHRGQEWIGGCIVMDAEIFECDPGAFRDTALPYLIKAEAENTLIIGIASRLASKDADSPESFFWIIRDGDEICAAAMWTPPHDLVLSHPFSGAALSTLSECLRQVRPPLPGVLGPACATSQFVEEWVKHADVTADLWRRERIYRLQRVKRLSLAPGRVIRAEEKHVPGLTPWVDDFIREVGEQDEPSAVLRNAVADGRLFLWWDGRPVSMAASTRPTLNGVAVNLVYTPPQERHRGYATAVVSTLSRTLLRQGRSFCVLYTDLSNPTSNSIYQQIGYQPILDCYHFRFVS